MLTPRTRFAKTALLSAFRKCYVQAMKTWFNFTRKPSEVSELISLVADLAKNLQKQSETILELAREKDRQIKMVLESKFQPFVQMMPPRVEQPREPESFEHLADVSEMSEATADAEMERATKREREADASLEEALREEFQSIAQEQAEAHK
jgi:hypothetical protein